MGIDEEVAYLSKLIALLLFAPGTSKAVAENGGLIARAQAGEVGSKLDVEFTQVLFPEVSHQCLDVPLVHPHDLAYTLFHFLFRNGPQGASSPHVHESFIQFPCFQMDTALPLFTPSTPRRYFYFPTHIKHTPSPV